MVQCNLTVSDQAGNVLYSKPISAKSWDQVEEAQMACVHALKNLGAKKRDHKAKHPKVDISAMPSEVLLCRFETPDPDVFNLSSIRATTGGGGPLGRQVVIDSFKDHLSAF